MLIDVRELTAESIRSYGWLLCNAFPEDSTIPSFQNAETSFWQEHIFDPGGGGQTELLSVVYRNTRRTITSLEVHRFTQQAVIPLTGSITQVVSSSLADGSPDIGSLLAFRVLVGGGICMRPGCWHATRVDSREAHCLILTRRSTTADLIAHLTTGSLLSETEIVPIHAILPA